MPSTVVIGAQWGDEGKGKIVNYLTKDSSYVVRYQGGNNAGHTVINNGLKYKVHMLPCCIIDNKQLTTPIITHGTVIDLTVLIKEIDYFTNLGYDLSSLAISDKAHLILPYHKLLDGLLEGILSDDKIGTTGQGIGPAYADKMLRLGLRIRDIINDEVFYNKLLKMQAYYDIVLTKYKKKIIFNTVYEEYKKLGGRIKQYVKDTDYMLQSALKENKNILFEGSQGTLLDIDHGTYPYVTSSHTIAPSVFINASIPISSVKSIIAVFKSYSTRVGNGPFITEIEDEDIANKLVTFGKEYGTTTGRVRRCGWFDLVLAKYVITLNQITEIALTKLDILTGLEYIDICTAYDIDGTRYEEVPEKCALDIDNISPIYQRFDSWNEDLTKINKYKSLPDNAIKYINYIESILDIPIKFVGVGQKTSELINRNNQ